MQGTLFYWIAVSRKVRSWVIFVVEGHWVPFPHFLLELLTVNRWIVNWGIERLFWKVGEGLCRAKLIATCSFITWPSVHVCSLVQFNLLKSLPYCTSPLRLTLYLFQKVSLSPSVSLFLTFYLFPLTLYLSLNNNDSYIIFLTSDCTILSLPLYLSFISFH